MALPNRNRNGSDGSDKPSGKYDINVRTDYSNEQVIIAAALVDEVSRGRLVRLGVRPEHFKDARHRETWRVVMEMHRRGFHYDLATMRTISSEIDDRYLASLEKQRPEAPPNLEFHVNALFWDSARDTAVRGPVIAFLDAIQDPAEPPERVQALARQCVDSLEGHGERRFIKDARQVAGEMVASIRARREGQAVWPFGIKGLDEFEEGHPERMKGERFKWRLTQGAKPGLLTVVTSLSGLGKSTFVSNIVIGQARMHRRVLWGVWEDEPDANFETLAAISAGVSRRAMQLGDVTDEKLEEIERRAAKIAEWVTFFTIPFGRNVGEKSTNDANLDVVQQHIATSGCDIFIADIWNRCLVDRRPDAEESAIIRTQTIAKETRCHIIATHQQRLKEIEKREDIRPTREGLKGSAALVEAPDYIFGLHRPDFYKPLAKTTLEVHCLKARKDPYPWAVEFDMDMDRGIISGGKTIPHDASPPGKKKKAKDEFLDTSDED